ncbi:MAG: transcriptional regulator NrdR [Alphaproteobacteria bacterium]|jgi:transcriptional repressor NrdR|nr:MAG: transcriptional regulator NrdR [Azospirillum sp. 51_20]
MKCPFCGFLDSQVKDSRLTEDGACIRRRRECPECGSRFTTFERVQLRELVVVKKNGDKERFDREKLELSLQLAVRKRPVAPERVEKIVTSIQRRLESSGETEISSRVIGEYAMEALAALDNVAYVRFASVYKDFCEVSDFEEFVAQIDEMAKPRDNKEKE